MLIFTAITPHPPLLIPTIGQDNLSKVKKTQEAMEKLSESLVKEKPDVVIIFSPHGKLMENSFTLNTAPDMAVDFKQFGDLETKLEFKNDIGLAHQIKEALETKIDIQMTTDENLDHGASVPLFYLLKNLQNTRVIPLGYCFKNNIEHFDFGKELAEVIHKSNKKIAVIASGDLSHCLTQNAPVEYSPQGKKFDKELIELIDNKKINEIVNLDPEFSNQAAECGLKSIIILLGILSEQNYTPKILSYQGPFGVGYLVCEFDLNK